MTPLFRPLWWAASRSSASSTTTEARAPSAIAADVPTTPPPTTATSQRPSAISAEPERGVRRLAVEEADVLERGAGEEEHAARDPVGVADLTEPWSVDLSLADPLDQRGPVREPAVRHPERTRIGRRQDLRADGTDARARVGGGPHE